MSSSFTLPPGIPNIDAALRDAVHGSGESRWVAALALGRARDTKREESIQALVTLLDDPYEEVRAQALEGLIEQAQGGASISEQLVEAKLADPSPGVRCVAIDAATVVCAEPKKKIATLLEDDDPSVGAACAGAMGDLGAIDEADRLYRLLSDPVEFVRQSSAFTLGALKDPRCEPLLVSLLGEKTEIACDAAYALGRLGSSTAAPFLEKVAAKPFGAIELKAMACAALVRCQSARGKSQLIDMLRSRRGHTRLTALQTLAKLPVEGIAREVAEILDRRKTMEASAAIQTLGQLDRVESQATDELERRRKTLPADLQGELEEVLSSSSGRIV